MPEQSQTGVPSCCGHSMLLGGQSVQMIASMHSRDPGVPDRPILRTSDRWYVLERWQCNVAEEHRRDIERTTDDASQVSRLLGGDL